MENKSELVNLENQLSIARKEINNLRKQLKSLNQIHRKECDVIYEKLNTFRCSNCESTQVQETTTASNVQNQYSANFRYIGSIHTDFPSRRATPRQTTICSNATGKLILSKDVFTNPQHALESLEQFSHMWIIFHFHQTESTSSPAKVAPPRLNGLRVGVLGTRSPHRPSPIGLSLVKINRIFENVIYFTGVDMIDGTPVIDIKPYIPHYDSPDQLNTMRNRSTHGDEEAETSSARTLDGEERERGYPRSVPGAITNDRDDSFNSESARSNSRMGEREAPDGEEEGTDVTQNQTAAVTTDPSIRVPRWIDNPVVSKLTVHFKMPAEIHLRQLGPQGEEKKRMIRNILSEDPRSVYLRERQGDFPYTFRIADLYVSCEFNDEERSVNVYKVVKSEGAEQKED